MRWRAERELPHRPSRRRVLHFDHGEPGVEHAVPESGCASVPAGGVGVELREDRDGCLFVFLEAAPELEILRVADLHLEVGDPPIDDAAEEIMLLFVETYVHWCPPCSSPRPRNGSPASPARTSCTLAIPFLCIQCGTPAASMPRHARVKSLHCHRCLAVRDGAISRRIAAPVG